MTEWMGESELKALDAVIFSESRRVTWWITRQELLPPADDEG